MTEKRDLYVTSVKLNKSTKIKFELIAKAEGFNGWGEKLRDYMAKEVEDKKDMVVKFLKKDTEPDDLI